MPSVAPTANPRTIAAADMDYSRSVGAGEDAPATVRLRRGVASRTMPGRGVAVSAGSTAVVINGRTAEQLWHLLEPRLRAGTTIDELVGMLPVAAAEFVRGLFGQLEEHNLLCFVEEPTAEAIPGLPYFENSAQYPLAAARRMGQVQLLLAATEQALLDECRNALAESGFGKIQSELVAAGDMAALPCGKSTARMAMLQLAGQQGPEPVAAAIEAGGWRVTGPTNGQLELSQLPLLLEWASEREENEPTQHPAVSRIGDKLAAAQMALAAMAAMEPHGGDSAFMVTNPDIVSEPHPLFQLERLPRSDSRAAPENTWTQPMLAELAEAPQPDPADILPCYESLWQGLLTPWNGPDPGQLSQLPMGAAQAGFKRPDLPGIQETGLSTTAARLNCLEALATAWAGEAGPHRTRRVGHTPAAALAAGMTHALDNRPGWIRMAETDAAGQFPARARRLFSTLSLRFGIDATVAMENLPLAAEPLFRATVVDGAGTTIGRGIAPRRELALEEALIKAAGNAQLVRDEAARHLAARSMLGAELPETRSALARWAALNAAQAGMEISAPLHCGRWTRAGLHVVEIAWEETA